jgi:hypothetical protein
VLPGLHYVVLDSDHLKLNKFAGARDGNYVSVSSNLARIASQAPQLIQDRRKGGSKTMPVPCLWILLTNSHRQRLQRSGRDILWSRGTGSKPSSDEKISSARYYRISRPIRPHDLDRSFSTHSGVKVRARLLSNIADGRKRHIGAFSGSTPVLRRLRSNRIRKLRLH